MCDLLSLRPPPPPPPCRHLYYYACVLPSLVFVMSPQAFLWNGVHLVLAPAAGHSGYEDHFSADQFHYLHHRYFSVNFAGANAGFLDIMFGTFQATLGDGDKGGAKARADAKSTLRSPPTLEFLLYLLSACGCVAAWGYAAVQVAAGALVVTQAQALGLALLAGFGPVVAAELVTACFKGTGGAPNNGWAAMAFQLGVGTLFCSIPVAWACYDALVPALQGVRAVLA